MIFRRCVVACLLAAITTSGQVHADTSFEARVAEGPLPLVIAQRALGGGHPENSLAGIRHAIEVGADMVKIDVQLTGDGRHILMHDPVLTRTTNIEDVFPTKSLFIQDHTLAEIKQLQLQDGEDGGAHLVPTLEEALDTAGESILVAIGLHSYDLPTLVGLLEERKTENLLLFFREPGNTSPLLEAATETGIKIFAGIAGSRDYDRDLEGLSDALGSHLAIFGIRSKGHTPELEAEASARGVRLSFYGVVREDYALRYKADQSAWEKALGKAPAAVVTAYPSEILEMLNR